MGVNKVVYGGNTLIDISGDTVTESDVAQGKIFHLSNGIQTVGTAGGGGGKAVQYHHTVGSVTSTSYSATGLQLQVEKTGIYTVTWTGVRWESTYTGGSRLYINNVAYGSEFTAFNDGDNWTQMPSLNNVHLNAGDVLEVYAKRGNSRYDISMYDLLIIEE